VTGEDEHEREPADALDVEAEALLGLRAGDGRGGGCPVGRVGDGAGRGRVPAASRNTAAARR
jgi:hypothetical protein